MSRTRLLLAALLVTASTAHGQDCPAPTAGRAPAPTVERANDPQPSADDFSLPLPCGGRLVLRHVCVPANDLLGDLVVDLGCGVECGRADQGFMERKRPSAIAGAFTLDDLPGPWRQKLESIANKGDGTCPKPGERDRKALYYFIGKYEVSQFQWRAVMEGQCPAAGATLPPADARPKAGISWFDAVDFTRRLTEKLAQDHPGALPSFTADRTSFLRLPTEAEWEYAARGGHRVTEAELGQEAIFPLRGRSLADYAVFADPSAPRPPEGLAAIGGRCANPLGLHDVAGNAAEMTGEPFSFSIGRRLHGAVGGFVSKGGSFIKGMAEIMPGRREEQPFFLGAEPFRARDLGFRIVLSAIVTPEGRAEALRRQWTALADQDRTLELDRTKDPMTELDRLIAGTREQTERNNLLALKDILQQNNLALAEQQAQAARGVVRSAVFTAEAVRSYAIRRALAEDQIKLVREQKKDSRYRGKEREFDELIAMNTANIAAYDRAIDEATAFYLSILAQSRRYNAQVLNRQVAAVESEIAMQGQFGGVLKTRLEAYKSHLARFAKQGALDKASVRRELTEPPRRS